LNFVGKFDAQLPSDGFPTHSHVQVEHPTAYAPADAIIVPDAHLLFGADFKRAGVDLILSNADRELVVHDYFKGEHRHPLASPDGAHLTGDIVNALTGQVQYAQAGAPDAVAHVIGHVTKLTGSATAVRNGVSVILNNGDNVEKGDVVATGSDSTLGVTFIDGTVFGLSSNARMVLNEMVYDPNGSNNSSLISLVAGTISFVAGETAKHGDMKVDTPVATMGIRGTAVLVEIDFGVPGQNGLPDAKFQVLVEPDGTTGSYILFDKTTLDPIATVNKAGQQVNINQNGISYSNSPLTPELQKLISDVFSQKFSNVDTNTKSFDHLTDSIVPLPFQGFKGPDGITVTPVILLVNTQNNGPSQTQGPNSDKPHVDLAPSVGATSGATPELAGVTGSSHTDTATGFITFNDVNLGDQPTASAAFKSFSYQNAQHVDISQSLTPTELAAVKAVEINLNITQDPAGQAVGTALWSYSISDSAFDFLGNKETLTLTYYVTVSNNYAQSILTTTVPITITITGSNDVPKIDSAAPQTIAFNAGTNVPGGNLIATVPTSGKITFDDPDLTDTHTVSTPTLATVTLTSPGGAPTPYVLPPTPEALLESALTASLATDSTGTGLGSIDWSLASLPVWLGDFIPLNDTLTLTYVVTVTDSQGATATQDITVTITGTAAPAEVWIATTGEHSTPDGLWSTGVNWETGLAPTASSDAIIITNQLEGLTPTYPVTITSAVGALGAAANSITMDNFGGAAPVLINQVKLAVGTTFDINDHSTDNPVGYTGPEFDNQGTGTVTIGGAFNLNADAVVHNAGSITVNGKMEALDQSTVQNSGTITLAGGGDFGGQSTISNTVAGALIEVSSGLLNVDVDISNLGTVKIDPAAALTLSSAAIDGGIVTNNGTLTLNGGAVVKNGTLGNSGQINVSGTDNALDNEQVTNTGGIEVLALGALTLDLLTSVTNTGHTITVDGTEDGSGTLTLQGGASITGGNLSNSGTVDIEGSGATLDGVTVTGSGAINVDVSAQTTLVLEDVTSITGNTLTVGPGGTLSVAGNATLDDVGATNKHSIEITAGNVLTLDDGTSVDNTSGTIAVDGAGKLTLNDAEITGGTINDFDAGGSGTIDVTGSSKIDGGATLNNGNVTVENATLTLDNVTIDGSTITEEISGSLVQIDANSTLTLEGSATIQGASGVQGAIDNAGTVEVAGDATLLDVTLTNTASGSIIQIDNGATLTLSGAEITGGTINDFNTGGSGTIDVTGSSKIDGGATLNNGNVTVEKATLALDNVTVNGSTITEESTDSIIQIDANFSLTLEGSATIQGALDVQGVIDNAGTVEVAGDAALLDVTLTGTGSGSVIQVDGDATLTLSGAEITGGTINDFDTGGSGTIDVTGSSKIDGGATLNHGNVTVENATLTLDNVTVNLTTFDDTASGAAIHVDGNDSLTLNGVNIHGGAIDAMDAGSSVLLENTTIAGATLGTGDLTDANSGLFQVEATTGANTSILDGSTDAVSVAGYVQVEAGANLELIGTIHNSGTIDIDPATGTPTLSSLQIQGTVTLDGGGTVTLDGPSDQIIAASGGGTLDNYETISGNGGIGHAGDGTLALHNESGGVIVASGGALTIDTGTTFINDGTIGANSGGKLVIDDVVTGTGSATLDGGTLEIGAGGADAQAVTFGAAGGKLQIDQGGSFTGSIAGLVAGDQIDLSTIGYGLGTTGTYVGDATGGTLTVTDGTNSVDLHLVGDYTDAHFAGSADSNGDLLITLHANDDPPIIAAADKAETATLNELASTTGSAALDPLPAASGAIHFTDIDLTDRPTADVKLDVIWTNGPTDFALTPTEISALESAFVLTQSGNTNNGTLDWTYQITDSALDFLGAGETATVTAAITLDDHQGITDTATVTVTIGGSNDAPVLAADTSGANGTGLHAIPELAGKTGDTTDIDSASGSLSFTDVDLTDTHTVAESVPTYVWSGGSLTTAQTNALTSAAMLALTETDSTHTGAGSVAFTYSAADSTFDFLAAGETLTVTYDITVTDKSGVSSSQPVSFTVTGSNDAPVLAADTSGTNGTGLHAIAEIAGKTGDTTDIDSASGTLSLTDVDLDDTHTVTKSAATYVWSGGTLRPTQISALNSAGTLALTETDSTHTGAGSVGFAYSAADSTFDFLAAGATLTVTYDITVTDHSGASSMEPVTFTVTGSNDAPTIAGETNPVTQTVILTKSPVVLGAGISTNSLGLSTETFDESGITAGSASNNGAGHGNFTSAALDATFSGTGDAGVVHGSSSVTAAPFVGPSPGHADTTNYLSIGANGSETITFATEQNEFGLYWGSVDSFNAISFYDGTQLVATYTGAAIAPLLANGNQGSFSANGYVEFSDLAPFTKVVLTSGSSNAFEIDNISAGFVSDSHVQLAGPITGTITVKDADIGDTLTASVTGNAVAEYDGSTTLPAGVDVSALIAAGAITFDTVTTTGGQVVLDWTYNPTNPDLDFLEPGDTLTLTFNATVSDGHATTAVQPLAITLTGNGSSVVTGTSHNDTFTDVGGGVTITGGGGHDVYNFQAHFGSATITDFDVSNDVIDISSTLFTSVTALLNSAVASGANTIITDSAGDKITLDHVSVAQLKANPGDFQFTIANGGAFEAGASTSENVVFEGSTGKLTIDTPSSFTGVISGFTGDGTLAGSDQIDLKGIDHNLPSFTESFNAANDTLFVSDGTHSTTLHFTGAYQAQNFSFTTDNNGGTIVFDPPVPAATASNAAANTPPVSSNGHGFVFNFADNGHDMTGGNHPAADTHLFDSHLVTDAGMALNKLHDDNHAVPQVIPSDGHDPSAAAAKAQWHASDFHFV